jgi:hypothetical protein
MSWHWPRSPRSTRLLPCTALIVNGIGSTTPRLSRLFRSGSNQQTIKEIKESKRIKHAKRRTRSTASTQANCPLGGNQQTISKEIKNQQTCQEADQERDLAGSGAGRKPGVVRYGAPRRLRTRSGTREVISINQKESASMKHGGAQTNSGGKRPRAVSERKRLLYRSLLHC